MSRPSGLPLGPDVSQMSREDLMRTLQSVRTEVQQLRAENASLRASTQSNSANNFAAPAGSSNNNSQPGSRPSSASSTASSGAFSRHFFPNQKYSVSMNVLVIAGGADHRCRTMPLQAVLERSAALKGGVHERDADTPINSMMAANAPHQKPLSDPFARHSLDLGPGGALRFSGIGGGGHDGGGRNSSMSTGSGAFDFVGGGGTATRLSALTPGQLQQQQHGMMMTGGRPSHLSASTIGHGHGGGAFQLDADALVSNHTLAAFARAYVDAPLSPQSMTATTMVKYLVETFARNGCVHEPNQRQMEAVGRSLLSICTDLERILATSPSHPEIPAPVYVFGDIHGNFSDLHYFLSTIINFGDMRFVPLNLMFLGDYVDRGPHGVEVVAFLFALKVLAPSKVCLLRGNHEDALVNGDLNLYRDTSFRFQCRNLFGELIGEEVWQRCNRVFAYLPLTASIDGKIFCTHGGLPRYTGGPDNRMEMLKSRDPPRLESFFQVPENESRAQATFRQLACDVCWSDPAEDERMVDEHGFGNNPRGAGVILFGGAAVDRFLSTYGFEYIFRAHQEKSDGLKISKNARVVTVFSTSGYVGHQNGAGVVYVADGRIRLIIKEHEEEGTRVADN